MSLTRSQLRSHVAFNLGNRTGMNARINDYLDWALEDCAAVRNWRDMVRFDHSLRTVAGQVHYGLPDGLKDLLEVRYLDGSSSAPLAYIEPVTFRQLYPHPEEDGDAVPTHYTWEGDFFKCYPLADESGKVLELYAAFWPAAFATDDDTCPLPRLDRLLIAQATAYGYQALREPDQTAQWRGHFYQLLKRAGRAEGPPSAWTPAYASVRLYGQSSGEQFVVPAGQAGQPLYAES